MSIFDKDFNETPCIEILLHSSYKCTDDLEAFLDLNKFKQIIIVATPTTDDDLIKKYHENNITPSEYKRIRNHIVISQNSSSRSAILQYSNLEKSLEKMGSVIIPEDLSIAVRFDYFIVDPDDPIIQSNVRIDNLLTLNEIRKEIRLLLSNKKIFLYKSYFSVGETMYYIGRIISDFKSYNLPFNLYVWKMREPNSKGIFEQIQSLQTRLIFITKSYERALFCSYLRPNNSTFEDSLYYIGYLVMLCTGALDDIAWIFQKRFDPKLQRRDVSLKKRKKGKLEKCIKEHDSILSDHLYSNRIQNLISSLNLVRDAVQHRNFIDGFTVQSGRDSRNMINIDDETSEKIELCISENDLPFKIDKSTHREQHSMSSKDIVEFIYYSIREIINTVLRTTDWNPELQSLNKDKQKEVLMKTAKSNEEPWEYFRFSQKMTTYHPKPTYFFDMERGDEEYK